MTRKTSTLIFLFVPIACITIGCQNKIDQLFKDPYTNPVRKVLKITMPVAYAANLSMAALTGQKPANVQFVKGGDTTLGAFLLQIMVDNTFPLPQGIMAAGQITVGGLLMRQETALMTMVFTNLKITQGILDINDISTVPAILETDVVTGKKQLFLVLADEDVNRASDTLMTIDMSKDQVDAEIKRYQTMKSFNGSAMLEQNTFIIQVDNNRTPSTPSDDVYDVSGAGQYIGADSSSADITQIIMMNLTMKTSCKRNPSGGWVGFQNFDVGNNKAEIGHLVLNGHTTCDGAMKVDVATGVYSRSWGKDIALNLGQ